PTPCRRAVGVPRSSQPSRTTVRARPGAVAAMCQGEAVEPALEFRRLYRTELTRVAEIDRSEHINFLYDQSGTHLVPRQGNWESAAWDRDGHGEHSVPAQVRALHDYADAGGIALGAFAGGRMVGI